MMLKQEFMNMSNLANALSEAIVEAIESHIHMAIEGELADSDLTNEEQVSEMIDNAFKEHEESFPGPADIERVVEECLRERLDEEVRRIVRDELKNLLRSFTD